MPPHDWTHAREILQAIARQRVLRRQLGQWREAAQQSRAEARAAQRGATAHQRLMLRRGLLAWRLAVERGRHKAAAQAAAERLHRRTVLAEGWAAWKEWMSVCRSMRQRQAARLSAAALAAWRLAVQAAERR